MRKRKAPRIFPGLQSPSSSSERSSCFKWRRADFLIARRSAATACFSAWRSRRIRVSTELGKCEIFGRCAPPFRSFGFGYGSIEQLPAFICDKKERQCCNSEHHRKLHQAQERVLGEQSHRMRAERRS